MKGVPTRILWIGSLPSSVTEQDLKERFQRFGNSFLNARIFRKTNSATIYYGKLEDAKLAYKQTKNLELWGHPVKIDYGMVSLLLLLRAFGWQANFFFANVKLLSFLMKRTTSGCRRSRGKREGSYSGPPRSRGKPQINV